METTALISVLSSQRHAIAVSFVRTSLWLSLQFAWSHGFSTLHATLMRCAARLWKAAPPQQQCRIAGTYPGGVTLVRIEVQLQSIGRRSTYDDVAKYGVALAVADSHFNHILVVHPQSNRVGWTHMYVAQRTNCAPFQLHAAGGTFDGDARRIGEIPRDPHWGIQSQGKLIATRYFDLVSRSRRTKHANMSESAVRADKRDSILRGKLSGLHERRKNAQLIAHTEQLIDSRAAQMHMAGGDRDRDAFGNVIHDAVHSKPYQGNETVQTTTLG